ncbi:MAG: ThiF family adenylyltransferase [Cyclobacteriaceae bacterium]
MKNISRPLLALAERYGGDLELAEERMANSSVHIICGEAIRNSYHLQVALLTSVNISKRIFLGGIKVELPEKIINLTPHQGKFLNQMIKSHLALSLDHKANYTIYIGMEPETENSCEILCNNWQGGIRVHNEPIISLATSQGKLPFGAIASAGIACFKAFDKVFEMTNLPFHENAGISLWDYTYTKEWHNTIHEGSEHLERTIYEFWFVGLGHLGQAYLWLLSFLPFENAHLIKILLQDHDMIDGSNWGSQLLVSSDQADCSKARICATFLESIGFTTRVIEKPLEKLDQEMESLKDFKYLINGLDNVATRRILKPERFKLILDGATNGAEHFFDSFTMNTIDVNSKRPKDIWNKEEDPNKILHPKLFERIEKSGGCGSIINHSISTPFVGALGASILMSELFKRVNNISKTSYKTLLMRDI